MARSPKDPFPAFRFKILGAGAGGFSECSGLGLEIEVLDHHEGGVNDHVHKLPTRVMQGNVTLKRGVVDASLWKWCASIVPGRVDQRSVTIKLLDESGAEALSWQLKDAFPVRIQGPDFGAGQSNVAVETLEICHQGFLKTG